MAEIVGLLAVVVVAIAAHEFAHVGAARAVGQEIFAIQIGVGPQWSFRVQGVDVGIGAIPLGGFVQARARSANGFRWRSAVVAGSGVTANLGLTAIGLAAGIRAIVVFNLLVAGANLWPGGRRRLGIASSDGRVLLDLARNDVDAIAEERSGWFCIHATRAHDAGDLDEARRLVDAGIAEAGETRALLAVAGIVAFGQRRFADVVDAYVPLIDDDRVSVAGRAGFAADAAWSASLLDDPAMRELALPWAAFAFRVGPRTERRRLALALAQVDAGTPDVAQATLGDLISPSAAAVRSLALAAEGDLEAATSIYVADVLPGMDADHPLLARVAEALRSQDPPPG